MQTLYVPKYGIHYRVNPKNPCELQWSKKPFGPMTAWQKAYTFKRPIRALDIDDDTEQGVVVLNDSSTYVGSGVRVWGKKFYTAGSRIYSLYAIGESKMTRKLTIKVHEAYTPHWKADDIDGYVHTLWDQDIVKEVISTRYPDYPEITWKLYDNDGNLITIVSLAQDMLHVMRPGHYYSKSITGWGRAFWQGDQLANIKNLFDEFRVYDYVPTEGHQPKKNESLKTQRKVAIKVHESTAENIPDALKNKLRNVIGYEYGNSKCVAFDFEPTHEHNIVFLYNDNGTILDYVNFGDNYDAAKYLYDMTARDIKAGRKVSNHL